MALQTQVNDPFLAKVEFYVDNVPVGESDLAPYGVFWQARAGMHGLRVVGIDRAGQSEHPSLSEIIRGTLSPAEITWGYCPPGSSNG